MFSNKNKENKAKLEHKLYLARENPEPIFDLSECGLKLVPQGIYSLCKVFLKEQLDLSRNNLSSLSGGGNLKDLSVLKILDLQHNSFTSIPEEIGLLVGLTELYINNNQLKKLHSSICKLSSLQVLDISCNKLQCLPEELGSLINLKQLNVLENQKLNQLPKSICQLQRLTDIKLDYNRFLYPPTDIAQNGTESILMYICKDEGIEYNPPKNNVIKSEPSKVTEEGDVCDDGKIQAKLWELEKIKAQKLKEFLEIEKFNELQQRQELEVANASKANREKFLKYLTDQQSQFDKDLVKIQREKDFERFKLIEQLQEVERRADIAIKQLLTINNEPLLKLIEQEKEEEAQLIESANKYNEDIRKNEILEAMQRIIKEETAQFVQFNKTRLQATNSILEQEVQADSHMLNVLQHQISAKSELISQIQDDEQLQRIAVGALLERSDARSWGLVQQVRLVEYKLAELTSIELDKRKLQVDDHVNDIAEKRINLSVILIDLLEKQEMRRAELISTLKFLEQSNCTLEDFWLRQYQNLLNRMPRSTMNFQRYMDKDLAENLLMAGVVYCMPFLAKWDSYDVKLVTDEDLINVGITSADDREKVLLAIHCYANQKEPSAEEVPSTSASEPTAPPASEGTTYASSECVICMDQICQIIYVPCGHFCCCTTCSSPVEECPLCRVPIEKKIRVINA